jgi:uncharacterized protein (DUF433 family)
MAVDLPNRHIEISPEIAGGKPRIAGRRITVQNIVVWHERLGQSVDEIAAEHNLSFGDIHAALTYYYDHQPEIDQSIEKEEAFLNSLKGSAPSPLRQRLAGS